MLLSAVLIPAIFVHGTHLNRGAWPFVIGGLGVGAVVFVLSFSARRWQGATLAQPDDATRSLKLLLTQGYELESWLMSQASTSGDHVDDRLRAWARAVWDALRSDHPREAKDFFGDSAPYQPAYFTTAYAIARADDPLRYLRSRVSMLERAVGLAIGPKQGVTREPAGPPEHVQALRERARLIRHDPLFRPLGQSLTDRSFVAHFPDAAQKLRVAGDRLREELAMQRAFREFVATSAVKHFPQDDGWLSEPIIQNTVWLFVTSDGDVPNAPLRARNDGAFLVWGDTIMARGGAQEKCEALRKWLESVARSDAATRLLEAEAESQIARDALGETLALIQQGQIWKVEACPACAGVG